MHIHSFARALLTAISLVVVQAAEAAVDKVIADLEKDFQKDSPAKGWAFMWNPTGVEIGDHASYEPLDFHEFAYDRNDYEYHQRDASDAVVAGNDAGNYLKISDLSHSGFHLLDGKNAAISSDGHDHYLIVAYTVRPEDAGFLKLLIGGNNHSSGEVRIYQGKDCKAVYLYKEEDRLEWNLYLGDVKAGETLYLAYKTNSNGPRNARRWYARYQIVKTEPQEIERTLGFLLAEN